MRGEERINRDGKRICLSRIIPQDSRSFRKAAMYAIALDRRIRRGKKINRVVKDRRGEGKTARTRRACILDSSDWNDKRE